MSITGTFVLKQNENYDAWLKAVGVPADVITKLLAAKPKLISSVTDTGLTVKTVSGDKEFTNHVVFGQDSPTDVAGLKYTINVQKTDKGYKGTLRLGDKSGTVSVESTDDGIVQITTVDGVTAKRYYVKE